MFLLVLFAFLAGIVTVLSPCILPVLPIVLSSSIGGQNTGKRRPFGVVTGFILSFTFFTLFLSALVNLSGISAESLRMVSVFIIGLFGISYLIPQFQAYLERLFSYMIRVLPSISPGGNNPNAKHGFMEGLLIGFSIGLLWTPCVGPILASVISLAITGQVTYSAFIITLAYAIGTAIPMFAIMISGQKLLNRVPLLLKNTGNIQKGFGIIMILTAVAIFNNYDRKFQTFILEKFPSYGTGLTQIEDNSQIREELDKLNNSRQKDAVEDNIGKTTSDMQVKGPVAPELIPGGQWFNSKPLKLSELKGKVVILDFWTYSCINCQRTLPYLKSWYEKYNPAGLEIIGVHSPEFEFEKNPDNLSRAISDFGLKYPIMQDNDFSTWRAYENRYWPAKYLIDKDGYIRYTHFGEGEYNETENMIIKLLEEKGSVDISKDVNNPGYSLYSKTPEIYLGYERIEYLESPEIIEKDQISVYTGSNNLSENHFAYSGRFKISREYANPQQGANLLLNFEAKEVFLVMNPIAKTSKVKIYLDGKQQFLGSDADNNGIVTVDSSNLYKLILLENPGRHELRLEFLDNNTQIFAFTFG